MVFIFGIISRNVLGQMLFLHILMVEVMWKEVREEEKEYKQCVNVIMLARNM